MVYYKIVINDVNSIKKNYITPVAKPTANASNGRFDPKELGSTQYTDLSTLKEIKVSKYTGYVRPKHGETDAYHHKYNNYTINGKYSWSYIKNKEKDYAKTWNNVDSDGTAQSYVVRKFMNEIFDTNDICYFDKLYSVSSGGNLFLTIHKKGNWTVKKKEVAYYGSNIFGHKKGDVLETITSSITSGDARSRFNSTKYNNSKVTFEITLGISEQKKLGTPSNWEVGQVSDGNNIGNYCFYCNDNPRNSSNYTDGVSLPVTVKSSEKHSCKIHGLQPTGSTDGSDGNSSSSYNDAVAYKPRTKWTNNTEWDMSSLSTNKKLQYGVKGEYTDGVAPMPYVMIELRGSIDSDSSSKVNCYNLSIPANSFVSLSHQRNIDDSYNTFSLQLFDKDAMQVEAKLVLGFRYITFWYTDFISTSKRFKGEVLNYKTVITGKGLMLTLEGYTTNVETFLSKDSIPWSVFGKTGVYEFYYWTNKAGEYHGEVYVTKDKDGVERYNSSGDGVIVPPLDVSFDEVKNVEYSLKYSDESTGELKWDDFDSYYSGADADVKDRFRPYAAKWTLESYNKDLAKTLAKGNDFDLYEKRPSDIVKLICGINHWLYKDEYIVRTRKVTEIPDQVSMSYIQYIKEKLLPISVSEGKIGSTQYYFWFDDEGYAHYGPKSNYESGISLYFNSVDRKDSYPLIAFTSATNGAVLMSVDKTQTVEAINVLTGDELSLSSVVGESEDRDYISSITTSSEWYSTNIKTLENSGNKLISHPNISVAPSEDDLKNMLATRYGTIQRYSFKASLDVYCCADLTPGQTVDIYIYVDDGERSDESWSKYINSTYTEVKDANGNPIKTESFETSKDGVVTVKTDTLKSETKNYKGNITMHHTSGTYFINKITDTIAAGKYISSLEVFKIDKSNYLNQIAYESSSDTQTSTGVVGSGTPTIMDSAGKEMTITEFFEYKKTLQ